MAKEYLDIELTEDEKNEANEWIKALMDSESILRQPLPVTFTEDMSRNFYRDVCQSLADAKVMEHLWRIKISSKYKVNYEAGFENGRLFLEDYDDEWKI